MTPTLADWFSLQEPEGPRTPFGAPDLSVYDSLRVVIFALTTFTIITTFIIIKNSVTLGQVSRIVGATGLCIVSSLTELNHLGDYANWRLGLNLVFSVAISWGYWAAVRYELPSEYFTEVRKTGTDTE